MAGAQERENFYNKCEGGQFGDISRGLSPEEYVLWVNKVVLSLIGRKHSEETRRKMSKSHTGKTYSYKTIEKMRINNTGSGNPMFGKEHSEETKMKISENNPLKKSIIMSLNGTETRFDKVVDCYSYLENHYGLSRCTTKKLLRINEPFHSKYKRLQVVNGLKVFYDE